MLIQHRLIAILVFLLLTGCGTAYAQDTEPPGSETPDGLTGPALKVKLAPIYFHNGTGVLVPVPGMTLEKFQQILREARGLDEESDGQEYSIESLTATGRASGNRADLSVALAISIDKDGWVRIPLRLGQAALLGLPGGSRVDRPLVTVEESKEGEISGGYVLWLRGHGEETTENVSLDFTVPISVVGREHRLRLSVPGAVVSTMKLTVPMADADAEVLNGGILDPAVASDNTSTELTVRGLRGDVDLVWRKANGNGGAPATVLTSVGTTVVARVDRRQAEFEAELSVRARGRPLTHFEVRLPLGATLSEVAYDGYTITDVTAEDQDELLGRLVEVNFAEPVRESEAAKVIVWATTHAKAATNGRYPLAGFDVVGAIHQSGTVVVRERGEWDVRCDAGHGVDQVAPEIPPSVKPDEVIATFEFYDQPFELAARVFPKQTRISVEPRYVMSVESGIVRLFAKLKYTVRGSKAYQLQIDMNGWELDRIGPDQLVVAGASEVNESGILPISLQDGMMDVFELSLRASRRIDSAEGRIELPLPQPEVISSTSTALPVSPADNNDPPEETEETHGLQQQKATPAVELPEFQLPDVTSLTSTELFILPADNIDLREDTEKTTGLQRQKVVPVIELPEFQLPGIQQEPLFYRGESDEAVFAAILSVREQEITVEASTEVHIAEGAGQVEQHLQYDVKYVATSELSFRVPRELAASELVEFLLDGEPVAAVDPEQPSGEDWVLRKIVLPEPRKGRFELESRYSVSVPKLQPQASVLCVVPIILPEGVNLTKHRVPATVAEGLRIWVQESNWLPTTGDAATYENPIEREFAAETPESRIVFGVHQEDPDIFGSTVVKRAWVQTWMMERQRRDRAVYAFVSDRRHLSIVLPEGADTGSLRVVFDGDEVQYELPTDHRVRVALPSEQVTQPHVMELWYRFTEARPSRGSMTLELPEVADDVWVRRSYWQLVLPSNEHVVTEPLGFTPEYEWGWQGLWWGRVPVTEQADLETWVSAVRDTEIPQATSRYLFSSFGSAGPVKLRTASRTWIVGVASAMALLIGLLVIYTPRARHPLFGLLLVIGVTGGAVIWPGASLLFAQAAGMGLTMSLLGAVLYHGVARRRRRTVRRDISSSILDRGSTQAQFGSSAIELVRSTATDAEADAVRAVED